MKRESIFHSLLLAIFFMSGFSALLYQVIWQRLLTFFTGVDAYSVTLIVASFMVGLGFGNLAGGFFSDRLSRRGNLILFALTQFSIGLFALVSKWLLYDVLYLRFHDWARSPLFLTGLPFLSLLCPAFLMGLSLPVLTKALCFRIESAAKIIGSLYGINTLGSALAPIVTFFFLCRAFGFDRSLYFGVSINLLCGIAALVLSYFFSPSHEELPLEKESLSESWDPTIPKTRFFPFSTWLLIYALSGFIALSLETFWFRVLKVMLRSETFTFPFLLSVYLSGLSLGVLAVLRWAQRTRHPAQLFFLFQSLVTLYAGLSVTVLMQGLGKWAILDPLWNLGTIDTLPVLPFLSIEWNDFFVPSFLSVEPKNYAHLFRLGYIYLMLPIMLFGIPTFLMGSSFPFLQKAVQEDLASVGRRVGGLQTANILGSVLGSFVVGFFFLHFLGTVSTLRLLVALGGIFLFFFCKTLHLKREFFKRLLYGCTAILIGTCIVLIPDAHTFWAKLHGTHPQNILLVEDETGVAVFKSERPNFTGTIVLHVDGPSQGVIPYAEIHTLFGLFPSLLHPNPKKIAVIGLGTGGTLFSIGGRPETEKITCIEIVALVLEGLKLLDPPLSATKLCARS